MRILITIMILWSSTMAFGQEIWQLSPWAPDSSYVIGAYPSGEPKWVKVDSLGVADSIYLTGDTIMLRDGSGSVILPCEQVYEIFIDKFTGVYTYPSEPVACGAFGYCEDPRTLFYYDGETWNIMVRDARITTSNDYPDKDEVIPLENADIYIDQDTTWFFTWENGWQIFSTKFKTDTLLITQIISDSLANITTEPDSIQRSGNIISLRDGSGSVNISDLVNVADSTSVLNSYGTIISETPANTFNVKVDSSLFATTYDITQKQNIITGTSGQTLRFDGTNTLIANSLLYNVGNQIGIGTITPTASYILDVAGNTKVRDGFLTVDGTVFINAATTLNMYNSANTGIFHSYQDGATSTDNIVYRGQYKTFTIGYNAGAGQSYANVANKKLHVNGAVSIGDGISATSVAANSLLVQGSATVQDRTGTASTLSAFDTNGKLVGTTLGTGLNWSGNTLNGNVGTVTGTGVATRVAFWNGESSLSSNNNLYWDNVNNELEIKSIPIGSNASNQLYAGQNAGLGATSAILSNFFGVNAGQNATNASTSNFFGYLAGNAATNANNSNFFGYLTGNGATGASSSNFFGLYAGNGATNASSSNFFGTNAGQNATGATLSNYFGPNAGNGATNASSSNFFGQSAGLNATNASNSNFFGFNTGGSFGGNNLGSNNIIIGTNISLPNLTSNAINLGGILFGTGTYSTVGGNPSITSNIGGKIGILSVNPSHTMDINGELRIRDLTTTSPVKLVSADNDGIVSGVTLGTGLSFTGNTLNATGTGTVTSVGINTGGGVTSVSGSPVTGSGNISLTLADQSASNELQTISTSGAAGNITLSNGGGTLNLNINDADASTTNELQNLSLSGQSLGISSGTGVTLPIVDVVAGSGASVSKVSGVATVSLSTILGQLSVDGNNSLSVTTSYTKLPFTSQAWNGTTTSTSTYDIQVPSDGFYELSFSGNFTENSASKIYGAFFINSTEQLRSRISSVALGTTDPINLSTSGIFLLSANDYISFRVKDTYVSNTLTYYSPTLSVKKL